MTPAVDRLRADPPPAPATMRRRRKRHGPPQLQFVTATDPSQFKAENAKKSVRSQAMIHYRAKAEKQRTKGKELPTAERITPILGGSEQPRESDENTLLSRVLGEHEEQHLYATTSAAFWGANGEDHHGGPLWQRELATRMPHQTRYQRAVSIVPLNAAAERLTEYDDSDEYAASQVRILIDSLNLQYHVGDGFDPFSVLPQFKHPEINSTYLIRRCNRAFMAPATSVKWLPAMLSHGHILLSSTILASCWLDMHAGCSGDSKRTVIIKGEALGWINERLRDPQTQFADSTLMVILHLMAGEFWSCNEKTLRIHQSGLGRLIAQRGGMDRPGGGTMEQISASLCYHSDIFCEATPLPIFNDWQPPPIETPIADHTAIPESPLYCPRREFFTILQDSHCSRYTYELLCDMRDLTDLFIAHNAGLDTILDIENESDCSRFGSPGLDYDGKISEIRTRVAALPSAYTPGLPISQDWYYEACRLASLIYTGAIVMRVPFSDAAEPSQNPILAESPSMVNSLAGQRTLSIRLTEALYEVLEKTNMGGIWKDMAGVLYWVSVVGAAAARTPVAVAMPQTPTYRSEAYTIWVRRCLIMFSTRSWLITVFEHPLHFLAAQKKILKVQELIGSGRSRKLVL